MVNALDQVPADFLFALGTLRQARTRSELRLEEIPAPARLAPVRRRARGRSHRPGEPAPSGAVHGPAAAALARASGSDDVELATGRFILLHDPDGSAVWEGEFRMVTYIRAQLEPEMGNDEMLGSVAWTWLVEALENHAAPYRSAGGHRHAGAVRKLRNPRRTGPTRSTLNSGHPGRRPPRISPRTWRRGPTWSAPSRAFRRCPKASRRCRAGAADRPETRRRTGTIRPVLANARPATPCCR